MADNQNLINNLIGGLEFKDSRLASLLQTLANDLYGLNRQINPPATRSRNLNIGSSVTVIAPTGFSVTVFTNDIRLSWIVAGSGIFLYEIKLGSDYDTADILLTTATHSADIDPVSRFILAGQTYVFWLTAIDSFGNRSEPSSVSIAIPNIGAPVLTNSVVGNNVLLKWTVPTSVFEISHYIIYRFGTPVGTLNGTFDVIFESAAGTYVYAVQAVDVVGNLGEVSGTISVPLGNPADFFLFNEVDSTFSGTKTNVAIDRDGALLCNTDGVISWEDHFTTNSWTSILDQLNAGYSYYYQPGFLLGVYEEIVNLGGSNAIVSLDWSVRNVNGVISIQSFISTSLDGITYTAYVPAVSLYVINLNYVKFKLEFTSGETLSAIKVDNLRALLSVRVEGDGGKVNSLDTDVSPGTRVNFNKTFQAIESVTITPESNTTVFSGYSDIDATGFYLYVWDETGARVSRTVSWAARGVI